MGKLTDYFLVNKNNTLFEWMYWKKFSSFPNIINNILKNR